MAGSTEIDDREKEAKKVALLSLDLYVKLSYRILAEAVEGLIKGACNALLSKEFINKWNRWYL